MSTAQGNEPKVRVGTPTRRGTDTGGQFEVLSSEQPPASQINEAIVLILSVVAAVCGVVFGLGVTLGWPTPLYGGALALGLFALAYAVRRFFVDRYPEIDAIEPRLQFDDPDDTEPEPPVSDLAEVHAVPRRPLLRWALLGSGATFAIGLLAPISTLGPRVGDQLQRTRWQPGRRLVTTDGQPIQADEIAAGGFARVWPEGFVTDEFSATLLLRLSVQPQEPTNPEWVIDGNLVAYSQVCTHAGCPVALYRERDQSLFCPCHQSTFDVARGAQPTFGPAARALPQLPLGVDDEGFLVALEDFQAQVGPAYG